MEALSDKFARSASGNVMAIVNEAQPDRIFRQTELPALLSNPDVTAINGFDRKDLALEPSKAFDRIQQGQLLIEDKRQPQPALAAAALEDNQPQRPALKPFPGQTAEHFARETQAHEQKQLQPQQEVKLKEEITRGL